MPIPVVIATNGLGAPIVISEHGAPFIVTGYAAPDPEED